MLSRFPYGAIAPQTLAMLQLLDRCKHADPKHVEGEQQSIQVGTPRCLFDDVLHQQVEPC